MSKSMEQIMEQVDSTKYVGIEITNKCSTRVLTDPKTYVYNGKVKESPTFSINQGAKGVFGFKKSRFPVGCTAGVLSYQFGNDQISLLASTPSKRNMKFALYVHDNTTPTNFSLYKKMYIEEKESDSFTKRGLVMGGPPVNITKKDIHVLTTVPIEENAILKIDIRDA